MRKGWIALLVVVITVAFAASALADTNISGFIRVKPTMYNYSSSNGYVVPVAGTNASGQSISNPVNLVDQRARLKITVGDENVKGVLFFEYDSYWGVGSYATSRNSGGGLETDTVNQETKNIYVWFKVPNTSFDFTVGIQNIMDPYRGTFFGYADVAGVFTNFKVGEVAFTLGTGKFWENNTNNADDIDLYVASAKLSPAKDVKLGLNLYYLNDMSRGTIVNTGTTARWLPNEISTLSNLDTVRVWMPGVDFAFNLGPANLSGFAFYQTGKAKPTSGSDVDIKGYAADLRVDLNLGPGKFFVEGIYSSGDDNRTDSDYKGILTGSNYQLAGSFYSSTDMFILLPNIDDITTSQALAYDVANGGSGLLHVGAGYSQKLTDKISGKVGVGYIAANKKRSHADISSTAALNFANEKAMGTEINAKLNYNIAKGLDFGVQAAYAFLGDAFKVASGLKDPDDLYLGQARLNYAF